MILSRYQIAIVAASLFAVAARAADNVVAAVDGIFDRCIDFIVSAFKVDAPRFAFYGPEMVLRTDRPSLSQSLLESLRHEKGVPRSGAARNI